MCMYLFILICIDHHMLLILLVKIFNYSEVDNFIVISSSQLLIIILYLKVKAIIFKLLRRPVESPFGTKPNLVRSNSLRTKRPQDLIYDTKKVNQWTEYSSTGISQSQTSEVCVFGKGYLEETPVDGKITANKIKHQKRNSKGNFSYYFCASSLHYCSDFFYSFVNCLYSSFQFVIMWKFVIFSSFFIP